MGPVGFIGSFSENDVDDDNTVVKTVPVYAGSHVVDDNTVVETVPVYAGTDQLSV